MNTLTEIKEFNMLQRNLELTKALQQVDKLKSENASLQEKVDSLEGILLTDDHSIYKEDDEHYYPSDMEEARDVLDGKGWDEIEAEDDEDVEDLIMPESLQKAIDEYDYEAACLQAEIEEARENDEFFNEDEDEDDSDFTHPPYEDIIDPEFDRGFDMAYNKAICDMMNYLEDAKKYILIGNLRNYLQGLRDSDDKWSI